MHKYLIQLFKLLGKVQMLMYASGNHISWLFKFQVTAQQMFIFMQSETVYIWF